MDYKEYYKDVARIRYTVAEMMKKHGLVSAVLVDNAYGDVNPWYCQICENGAFGIEYYYGTPSEILTPFGQIKIQSAGVSYSGSQLDAFLKEFTETFGVETVVEEIHNTMGCIGPYCSITKLPWKPEKKFPSFVAKKNANMSFYGNVTCPRGEESTLSYDDACTAYKATMKEVNKDFKNSGQTKYIIEDTKNK